MGYDIELYSVNLSTFFNALHSGNNEIVKEALAYVKREIIYKHPRPYLKPNEAARVALEEGLVAYNLEQLISKEGKIIASKKNAQVKAEDSLEKRLQPYIMNYSVLGILSLSPNFEERGIRNVSNFAHVFNHLKSVVSVSTTTIKLWESLMNDRLLVGEVDAYTNHTYLFNKELKDTLDILKYYDTELGKQHLTQARERHRTNPINDAAFWQSAEGQEYRHLYKRQKEELAARNLQFFSSVEGQRLKALQEKYNPNFNETAYYPVPSEVESTTDLFAGLAEEGADLFGILSS